MSPRNPVRAGQGSPRLPVPGKVPGRPLRYTQLYLVWGGHRPSPPAVAIGRPMRDDWLMSASTRIVVVGGGIVAASVAYHLCREGVQAIVIEADRPGPATNAGAGIICPWNDRDDPAYELSADGARYYPELLGMLAEDGHAETSYARVGALRVGEDTGRLRDIAAMLLSLRAGRPEIGDVELVAPGEPKRQFPPLADGLAGIRISGAARIDGRQIRDSMLAAAVSYGASLIHGAAVLDHSGGRVTGVTVGSDRVSADAVVVAAGAWTAQVCAEVGWQLPIGPQRGQIIHAEMPAADTSAWPVILPPADPYLLAFPPSRVVFGATREQADFDYRTTVGGVGSMLAAAMEVAPGLAEATLLETRIGFRPAVSDGRPVIGSLTDGLIVAAGNGPEGLTAGPWTGLAAAALALGQQPAIDLAPFDPARFQPGAEA
jgi:glycine/D-amino acid oxidase-like deaminating enzyme